MVLGILSKFTVVLLAFYAYADDVPSPKPSGDALVNHDWSLPVYAKPHGIALDHRTGKMYWTDMGVKPRVQRADFNGKRKEVLLDGAFNALMKPKGIGVHDHKFNSKVYWTDSGTKKIQRSDLTGEHIEDLVATGLGEPGFLALDRYAEMMYWTDPQLQKIQRAKMLDFHGTTVTEIFNSSTLGIFSKPEGIGVVPEKDLLYWADPQLSKICWSNLNGSLGVNNIVELGQGYNEPYGVAYDDKEEKLYWTDRQTKSIFRINLDGSDMTMVTTGLGDPLGIAFDSVAGTVYWSDAERVDIVRLRVKSHSKGILVMCAAVGGSVMILGGIGAAIFMHVPLGQFFSDRCSRIRSKCSRMRIGNRDSSASRGLVSVPLRPAAAESVPMYQVVDESASSHPVDL